MLECFLDGISQQISTSIFDVRHVKIQLTVFKSLLINSFPMAELLSLLKRRREFTLQLKSYLDTIKHRDDRPIRRFPFVFFAF